MKKNRINFVLRNNHDQDGLTEKLIDNLKNTFNVNKGYVFDIRNKVGKVENITYIERDNIFSHDSDSLNIAKMPLDIDTINSMMPYKEMAMNIVSREIGFDVYSRKYSEEVYYKHLKYWNEFIVNNNINLVISLFPPHHIGEYILFSLAHVKQIPTIFLYPQLSAKGTGSIAGTFFDTIGNTIKNDYLSNKIKYNYNDLSSFMKRAYSQAKESKVMAIERAGELSSAQRKYLNKYTSFGNFIKKLLIVFTYKTKLLNCNEEKFRRSIRDLEFIRKVKKNDKQSDHLDIYEKLSVKPDFSKKYIYYALQMSPEASTMPLAGEFRNQILSIELLSELAVKLDIQIYVKEHWVQYSREKGFYEHIANLPNVSLIDLNTNSIDLIKNSVAVSTQTGNVIFESLVWQKHAIVFSNGYAFKGSPNIIEYDSLRKVQNRIKAIINNKEQICEQDVFNYLKSIDDNLIYYYGDSLEEAPIEYSRDETAEKIIDQILKLYNFKNYLNMK